MIITAAIIVIKARPVEDVTREIIERGPHYGDY